MEYEDPYSSVVEIDEDLYLVQGKINDPIVMFRELDKLLECERDQVQKYLGNHER